MQHKRIVLIFIIILMMLGATACDNIQVPPSTPPQAEPTRRPTREAQDPSPVPSQEPTQTPLPAPTEVPTSLPSPTQAPYQPPLVSTEMQEDIWFSYDGTLWQSSGDAVFPNLQHNKYPECQIYLNNGHGMSESFVPDSSEVEIEGLTFTKTKWHYAGTNDIVLLAYSWQDSFLFTVENPEAGVLREQCLTDAEDVLRYSIMMDFENANSSQPSTRAQTEVTQPAGDTEIYSSIIVYAKDENIWAYVPEEEVSYQLTSDGGTRNSTVWLAYQNPKISPDRRFIAFEEFYNTTVQIYAMETGEIWSMQDYEPVSDSFDHLMGWDQQGRLYFSRQFGSCGSGNDITVTVLRFDFHKEQLETLDELPVSDIEGGAFAKGFDVSPSGRYFSYYETYCNPAFPGVGVLYDSQTEMYMNQGISGANSLSHNEQYLAYPHGYKFEELKNVYVVIKDIQNDDLWTLDNFEEIYTFWGNPHWSFDDRYLVISENSLADPDIDEYTPDIWWNLGNSNLVMIDFEDPSLSPTYLTIAMPETSDWTFEKWSPTDYRMLIVQGPSMDGDSDTDLETLWIFDPITRGMIYIDSGYSIDGADW